MRDVLQFFLELQYIKSVKKDYRLDIYSVDNATIFNREIYSKLSYIINSKYSMIPTLGAFFIKTGISLIFPVYNHTNKEIQYIDYKSFPDIGIMEGLLMSIYNPYNKDIFMYEDNHFSSCTIADKYPITYFNSDEKQCMGVFCEVDTASYDRFNDAVNSCSLMSHYILTRFEIPLEYKYIGGIIADGYIIEKEFKSNKQNKYKFPTINFKKY